MQRRGRRGRKPGPLAARASRRGRISAARPYRRRRRGRTRGAGRPQDRNIDGGGLTRGVAVEALERRQRGFEREIDTLRSILLGGVGKRRRGGWSRRLRLAALARKRVV